MQFVICIRVRSSIECGLRDKWDEQGILYSYSLFGERDVLQELEVIQKAEDCFTLDNTKIAFGPYIVGILVSVLAIFIEKLIHFFNNNKILFIEKVDYKTKQSLENKFLDQFKANDNIKRRHKCTENLGFI